MRKINGWSWAVMAIVFLGLVSAGWAQEKSPRTVSSFDRDWKFHRGEVKGAQQPDFSAADWRTLDVPHDFMIEGAFDKNSPATHNGAYLSGGIGWYRKTFTATESDKGKRISILFDGVYMDSDVWLNGKHLGNHPYGYTSFSYDLTPYINYGRENVLAVRVNVEQPCSRWYSGAGIYRHVWMTATEPVHVANWGTYITTPKISEENAQVQVRTRVANESATAAAAKLRTTLVDGEGKTAGSIEGEIKLAAGKDQEFVQTLNVAQPKRWSIEQPNLYTAVTEILIGNKMVDRYTTRFGLRTIEFTNDKGFFLNGKHVQIRGVCNHHDLGCLGAAVHRRGIERQLEILRSFGVNAIRTSHNPPAPELLELCDKMGFVVMDEIFDEWKENKTRLGYGRFFDAWSEKDIVSMLHRDRNHPSIILWSIGNEIKEQKGNNGGAMAKRLADFCRREDPTRFVTSACSNPEGVTKNGYANALDVLGINYHIPWYNKEKKRKRIGSETSSALSSRGEYNLVNKNGEIKIENELNNQCTSYDRLAPGWGRTASTSLTEIAKHPALAGEFVWTGFDYLGEPTPFRWPSRSSYFGIVDLCGFYKDRTYLYQAQWTSKPTVHLLPHWNWSGWEGKSIPVWAFSNGETVELFLNGKSLGEKSMKESKTRYHVEWRVPYAPGVLKAVAKKAGQVYATDEVHTAGAPAKLELSADHNAIAADGEDLSYITVRIVDKDGHLCPNANNKIDFKIAGPAFIAGVDNGDATSHEPFKASAHKAYHGMALAVIKAQWLAGEVSLMATTAGLPTATVTIMVGNK